MALALVGAISPAASAQQSATAAPVSALVLEGVTVVDIEHGRLHPDQRVVIGGHRIQAVGAARAVKVPQGGQVVDAHGKYLIPGLWDWHTHHASDFQEFIAQGITGVRIAATDVPVEVIARSKQEIAAGTRVGPRILTSGPAINGVEEKIDNPFLQPFGGYFSALLGSDEWDHYVDSLAKIGIADTAARRAFQDSLLLAQRRPQRLVDSLRRSGADFIKMYTLSPTAYFAIAAAARRLGIPFGGHLDSVTAMDASDSGARLMDHLSDKWRRGAEGFFGRCLARTTSASVERCQSLADRFRRNGTWWVPTLVVYIWGLTPPFSSDLRCDYASGSPQCGSDSVGILSIAHRVGMPILTGTDESPSSVHRELRIFAAEGLTPLEALRAATLNPAIALHATDSLGTVDPGKLADLVLLDADPLADIANTQKIHAVVANGRYFDRAVLDQLLAEVKTTTNQEP